MPMRRISTSLPRYGFADDPSPLSEGMANAAATLGELWPRLNQIEAEKRRDKDAADERKTTREENRLWQEQDKENQEARWLAQQGVKTGKSPELDAIAERVAAERKISDEVATLNLERLKNKPATTPANDLARDKFNYEKAVQEFGDPDYKLADDGYGKTIKVPRSESERQSIIDRINSRALEMGGQLFKPVEGFVPDEPNPKLWNDYKNPNASKAPPSWGDTLGGVVDLWGHAPWASADNVSSQKPPIAAPNTAAPQGQTAVPATAPMPTEEPVPQSAPPAETGASKPLSRQQLQRVPVSIDRATQTMMMLRQSLDQTADTAERAVILAQSKKLAEIVRRAKTGDQEAIGHLVEWDEAQPDAGQQAAEDKSMADAMEAAILTVR